MYYLKYSQKLPLTLEACWNFFSSPANLRTLTPDYLNFKITSLESEIMYAGQIIVYDIHPILNLPIEWVTEISHVEKPYYFIDEQRFGPYKFWHHEHHFKPIVSGIEMMDIIYYQLPFGILGQALHAIKIKRDLENIFAYRRAKLEKLFGPYIESAS
jgi:ligand-binding SRPBCC domain-containing protein